MTDNLGTVKVDPARFEWLTRALDKWQKGKTLENTKKLHSWCKKYCGEDAPTAPDEPEGKSEVEAEEVDEGSN